MRKYKNYRHVMKYTYVKAVAVTSGIMLLTMPLVGSRFGSGDYYEVSVDGQVVAAVCDPEEAKQAMLEARKRLSRESEDMIFMDVDMEANAKETLVGSTMSGEPLVNAIYEKLKTAEQETKGKAYKVKINEYTVTVASMDEVVQLLDAAKNKYDVNNEFTVELVADQGRELNVFTTSLNRVDKSENEVDTVASSIEGAAGIEAEAPIPQVTGENDGMVDIDFDENVEVVEAYVEPEEITPVQEAIDQVTKDKEKNTVYEVKSGDTISTIANGNDMRVAELLDVNEGLSEDTVIQPGDELILTVPEPELSVVTKEETTYDEDYEAPIQYIDNDSWYTTKEVVIQEGSTGHRQVTALVTSRNGKEISRDIIAETVTEEPVAKIVERGTLVPPTYIKPLSGGRLSSQFGRRWGRMHEGVDWACPVGTAVRASCGGTVIRTGWMGGYGNCILIQHPDGRVTRYAHLSKILVSPGQSVKQNDKIALSGNTGNSTGPHVHFEILIGGSPQNPLKYLN